MATRPARLTSAVVGLALAFTGGAAAVTVLDGGASFAAKALTKKTVKKIATKVAAAEIAKQAPTLTVARAGDADKLGGTPASGFARRGTLVVAVPPAAWLASAASGDNIIHSLNTADVSALNSGQRGYTIPVTVPSAANGQKLRLTRLRYCLSPDAGTALTREVLKGFHYVNGAGTQLAGAIDNVVNVSVAGCRVIAADIVLGPQDALSFSISIDEPGSPAGADLGAVTAQFEPTDQAAEPIG